MSPTRTSHTKEGSELVNTRSPRFREDTHTCTRTHTHTNTRGSAREATHTHATFARDIRTHRIVQDVFPPIARRHRPCDGQSLPTREAVRGLAAAWPILMGRRGVVRPTPRGLCVCGWVCVWMWVRVCMWVYACVRVRSFPCVHSCARARACLIRCQRREMPLLWRRPVRC